jgi:hypothetical protein
MRRGPSGDEREPRWTPEEVLKHHPDLLPTFRALIHEALLGVTRDACPPDVDIDEGFRRVREWEARLVEHVKAVKRARYDKARPKEKRPSGGFYNRPRGGMIVAVDSEGANFGLPFTLHARGLKHEIALDRDRLATWERAPEILKLARAGETVYRDQRAVLWRAGGVETERPELKDMIEFRAGGFTSFQSMELLTSLPARIAAHSPPLDGRPSFVGFSFDYDVAQILKDLSRKKLYQLQTGKRWDKRDDLKVPARPGSWVLVGPYAVALMPHKWIKIAKLKDRDNPWVWVTKNKGKENEKSERVVDYVRSSRILIEDVFGFYQQSLVKAIESMPKGTIVDDAELEIIKAGKAERGGLERDTMAGSEGDGVLENAYAGEAIAKLTRYTELELKATSRLVVSTVKAIEAAIGDGVKLKNLYGAGAAAQALLLSKIKDPKSVLGDVAGALAELARLAGVEAPPDSPSLDGRSDERPTEEPAPEEAEEDDGKGEEIDETTADALIKLAKGPVDPDHIHAYALLWATFAFFGGRIEIAKQGLARKKLYEPDISSAYPAIIAELPSMEGGRWTRVQNPTREQIRRACISRCSR